MSLVHDQDRAGDPSKAAENSCEKCGVALQDGPATVCKHCGWYAAIGAHVEIDHAMEAAMDPRLQSAPRRKATPAELLQEVPGWAWICLATLVFVLLESIAARLLTAAESPQRARWAAAQLTIGTMAFVVCHVFGFIRLMAEKSDTALLDILTSPLGPWKQLFRELPKRQWFFSLGLNGVFATLFALLIIGGLNWERLWDWGIEAPPSQNLKDAIVSQAANADGDGKSLEEAVEDFAGAAPEDDGSTPKQKPAKPKPRKTATCVIVGYRADQDGIVHTILLAREVNGKLKYLGGVTPQIDRQLLSVLSQALIEIRTRKPLLKLETEAIWVHPRYVCEASFSEGANGQTFDVQWEGKVRNLRGSTLIE